MLLLISSHKSSNATEFLGTLPISAHRQTVQLAPSEVQHTGTRGVSAIHFSVNSSVGNHSSLFEAGSRAEVVEMEGNVAEKK